MPRYIFILHVYKADAVVVLGICSPRNTGNITRVRRSRSLIWLHNLIHRAAAVDPDLDIDGIIYSEHLGNLLQVASDDHSALRNRAFSTPKPLHVSPAPTWRRQRRSARKSSRNNQSSLRDVNVIEFARLIISLLPILWECGISHNSHVFHG